jgi:hypothetical protein
MAILDDDSLPFQGRLGKYIIYKTKKGKRIIKTKGGPTAKEMKKSKSYETARKNGAEFGYASRVGRLLRDKFSPLLQLSPDGDFNNRLTGQLRKLIQKDTKNELGNRRLTNASLSTLPCIYLNDQCEGDLVTITIKETTISIHSDPKEIKKYIATIEGKEKPTHFQVFSLLLLYDFYKTGNDPLERKESSLIPISKKTASLLLEYELPVLSGSPAILHGIAIVFYQEKKGNFVMLGNKSLNGGWIQALETDLT